MTPEQLEAQSRAAIKAWCDDPSVELECCNKNRNSWGIKIGNFYELDNSYYRIAAPKKWYRVAKLVGGAVVAADNDMDELSIRTCSSFVEWITKERKYYD